MGDEPVYPDVVVDFMRNATCGCDVGKAWNEWVGTYITDGTTGKKAWIVCSYLSLERTYNEYIQACKKHYKGNVIRDARKADKAGFFASLFPWQLYIPDIYEINHSKPIRSGGPMRPFYLRSIDEMGGGPTQDMTFTWPRCPYHWRIPWGMFVKLDGYMQGSVVTHAKLLAYIIVQRIGNFAIYAMILGHGEYLKYGIMYRLHFRIIEWLCTRAREHIKGIKHVLYAGHFQGTHGLQLWKKKVLFQPAMVRTQ